MAGEMRMMKKLKNATCTNCPPLRVRLDKIEAQLSNVLCERHQQLNELFDMKYFIQVKCIQFNRLYWQIGSAVGRHQRERRTSGSSGNVGR